MEPKSIRIVFMGTPEFAVASLSALNEAGIDLLAVVTSPDKPAGRGKNIKSSAIKEFAKSSLSCPILQPENLKDPEFIKTLIGLDAHMFIVVAFRMLPKEVWSIPPEGTINLHASLLPQYRGAAPINWCIINGERQTGVTTFLIDHKIDTGKILLQESAVIEPSDSAGTLHDKLMRLGSELIVKTVIKHMADDTEAIEQKDFPISEYQLKKAPKIFKEDCKIDWGKSGEEIHNHIRGLSPYPAAFTILSQEGKEDVQLKIFEGAYKAKEHGHKVGTIVSEQKNELKVAIVDGYYEIYNLQLAGKKRMSTGDFLRGYQSDMNQLKLI